jgi:hypothetical protein
MRPHIAVVLVTIAACAPLALWAQSQDDGSRKRLQGTYHLYSLELGDTLPPTLKDSKLNLDFEGAMARKIYYYMGKSSEHLDECSRRILRKRGDLTCSESEPGKYSCSIGVNLKTGKTTLGTIC